MSRVMSDILQTIIATKALEIAQAERQCSSVRLRAQAQALARAQPTRDFVGALRARLALQQPAVIAEIKKASPSKGVIRPDFDVPAIAKSYARHGAACLSVLTDVQYFQGSPTHLQAAHAACDLPILRKDFTTHSRHIDEARCIGADAVLLIVAALSDSQLQEFEAQALDLGLAVLLEVHDAQELERALSLQSPLIGINNRNLRSFAVTLQTTLDLLPRLQSQPAVQTQNRIVVCESGILQAADVRTMRRAGVHSFLVGEALLRSPQPGAAMRDLFRMMP